MSNIRILIISQTFYPDHSGISNYASDFAFYCSNSGIKVDVLTTFPFYPSWKKRDSDKRVFYRKESLDSITIYRGYTYIPKVVNTIGRLFHELSLVISYFLFSFFIPRKPDIIVVFTTPILLGLVGVFLKKKWGSSLVINVQDFQIEAALSLGMLKKNKFINILEGIEKYTFRKSTIVSSITQSMCELLKEKKGLSSDKIFLWPNWATANDKSSTEKAGSILISFRRKYNIHPSTKIIGYAGNVGKKQGLSILVDLASMFSDLSDLLFLIIGDGADLTHLKQYSLFKKVKNLRFIPFLNSEYYHSFLLETNGVFVSQLKVPFDVYFPSKLLSIMASNVPIIIAADPSSELYKTFHSNSLGLVSEYGDIEKMKSHILKIYKASSEIAEICNNANFFVKRFDRHIVLSSVLNKIIDR